MVSLNIHRFGDVLRRLLVAVLAVLLLGALTVISALASGSGTWTPTGNLQANQDAASLTLLQNGQALAASAYGAELYNPSTGTWAYTGSMNAARNDFTATLLNNGQVLAAAGNDGGYIANAELYDPSTGAWTLTGSLNQARAYQTAALLQNGDVLVAGGAYNVYCPTYTAEYYTP
jgi:N-acetylneuraminic acid mutarotase